jgi:hypothetical protein
VLSTSSVPPPLPSPIPGTITKRTFRLAPQNHERSLTAPQKLGIQPQMSDVRFRNLDNVPLQEEFNTSTVLKISTASKIAAVVIGIISICVFTLTDNAKTAITTISSTDIDGKCSMLSSLTSTFSRDMCVVTATDAAYFVDGYSKLLKNVMSATSQAAVDYLMPNKFARFLGDPADSVQLYGVYFPTYQSCIDGFSKPPVCRYLQESSTDDLDRPFYDNRGVRVHNVCQSALYCDWPGIQKNSFSAWQVLMNVTNFQCNPSANFITCLQISSKCPEYASLTAGFPNLFQRIHSAEQMCQQFKSNPPYSCQTFQVISPIQVISQTLSLMATALGGSEFFLYFLFKYRRMWPSNSNASVQPESSTMP